MEVVKMTFEASNIYENYKPFNVVGILSLEFCQFHLVMMYSACGFHSYWKSQSFAHEAC